MQAFYKFLIGSEIFIGILVLFFLIIQKSSSEGLISQASNNLNATINSSNPMAKFSRMLVLCFFINSFLMVVVKAKIQLHNNPQTIIEDKNALPIE